MILVPDAGERAMLDVTLRAPLVTDIVLSLRLYKNDYTPVAASVLADFTEATFMGYFRRDLARADWSTPVTVLGRARSEHGTAALTWTNSGASQTVYGYFIVDPGTAIVWWAERFNVPRVVPNGGQLVLQPALTGRTEP